MPCQQLVLGVSLLQKCLPMSMLTGGCHGYDDLANKLSFQLMSMPLISCLVIASGLESNASLEMRACRWHLQMQA